MQDKDLYWLAGLLEGEGCFTCSKRGTSSIQIAMTDKDVMDRVHNLIGGHYGTYQGRPNEKVHYKVQLTRKSEVSSLGARLLPLMGSRRAEALERVIWVAQNDHRKARWS